MTNKGAIALDSALEKMGRGAANRLARALKAGASQISYWRRGLRKPCARFRLMIERELGIASSLWDEECELLAA